MTKTELNFGGTCLYYSASEIQELLGVSRGKAYSLIRKMNEDLGNKGFIVIPGKIPKKYILDHVYGGLVQAQC